MSSGNITITQPGYMYIFLSNEETSSVEVYFDDLKVTQVKSAVIEQQDYYPFGLTFNESQRENIAPNQQKYNYRELQDELGLGWEDYGMRMYLPELARWNKVDKMSDAYSSHSPYNYVLGNPLSNADINGEWTVSRHHKMTVEALSTAGIGGVQAKIIGHYASVYADNPGSFHLFLNNIIHPNYSLAYWQAPTMSPQGIPKFKNGQVLVTITTFGIQ